MILLNRKTNGKIMSETVSVPEGTPGELPLFLVGLAAAFCWQHRSARKRIQA